MESSRSKRRRLMLSYISSRPRPNPPAIFESLNDDTLTTVLEFVGDKSYRSFGGLNKHCKEIYLSSGMTKKTFLFGYAPLPVIKNKIEKADNAYSKVYHRVGKGVVLYNRRDVLDWTLQEQNIYSLRVICDVAAEEGRLDILDEVWNNIDDEGYKRNYVFERVDRSAASGGKLEVLKWLETKSFAIKKYNLCAREAAECGHIDILQWLQEEQTLELDRELYDEAADGGKFLVLKWLREQGCPWGYWTFHNAARRGNLDVLQWLHDEGCPWPEYVKYRVYERDLKPEVIDWLRVNGYSDKFLV